MLRTILLALFVLFTGTTLVAQYGSVGFGFKAGLNFSQIDGPSETGPNGEELESISNTSGFHIGALVNFKFTDLVGVRTEFTYSQRGSKHEYNGPSYFVLGQHTVQNLTIFGTRRQNLETTNSYIDIPVQAYYKFGSFEIFGGVNSSLLVGSTAGGNIQFNGIAPITQDPIDEFNVTLIHNYKNDEALGASTELQQVNVSGQNYNVPENVGAYYGFTSRDKNLYKTLDFGLSAGLSYYLNTSLFISARYVLGLSDVDRNEYDVSLQTLQNNTPVSRADNNKSKSLQVSVGFSF